MEYTFGLQQIYIIGFIIVDPEENDFECIAVLSGHSQDVKMVKFHPTKEVY